MKSSNVNLAGDELLEARKKIQENAGYHFKNTQLLDEALIHSSYKAENENVHVDNQRLEFFGDAVLQLVLSTFLFETDKNAQEGLLTRMRSCLANEEATANYSRSLELDKALLLGKGECLGGGRERDSILGDLFEAFLGALYLDSGLQEATEFILKLLPPIEEVKKKLILTENPKGALLEICQGLKIGRPEFQLVSTTGPDHARVFEVCVIVGKRDYAHGKGTSEKQAERQAAAAAYRIIQKEHNGTYHPGKAAVTNTVVALDFDGVICDSASETAVSAWKAARTIWPSLFHRRLPTQKNIDAFRAVRPYLETGYQAILMTKMLQEKLPISEFELHLNEHFQRIMTEHSLTQQQLIELFGATRDNWIAEDQQNWLDWHTLYPGVAEALKANLSKGGTHFIIATTKQERFVSAILKNAGIDFPEDDIFGLERKRKKPVLLAEQLRLKPMALYFIEDRLKTLFSVESDPELESVKLIYAPWGYGTANDAIIAQDDPHIKTMTLQEFTDWLATVS
ncbi:MAG: ribonuclease III [Victivallales bacterium]|nr:ribonuclease III [Victivallales bacterium]